MNSEEKAVKLLQTLVNAGVPKEQLEAVMDQVINSLYLDERAVMFRAKNIAHAATLVANM